MRGGAANRSVPLGRLVVNPSNQVVTTSPVRHDAYSFFYRPSLTYPHTCMRVSENVLSASDVPTQLPWLLTKRATVSEGIRADAVSPRPRSREPCPADSGHKSRATWRHRHLQRKVGCPRFRSLSLSLSLSDARACRDIALPTIRSLALALPSSYADSS
ncbi:unnamed protein product [Protopolystoma xenopodis]|uniref:Uncharacterized protein n=1 Tax=Protopolystoma xenopodis TaxID=117903 RepID=A0A448XKG9_9PLAT|nr:unnamed protein product [Protopolystoma xenopodis]